MEQVFKTDVRDSTATDLFAYFGAAIYYIQFLEYSIGSAIIAAAQTDGNIEAKTNPEKFLKNKNSGLGSLLKAARKHKALPEDLIDTIDKARVDRNKFIHEFFTHNQGAAIRCNDEEMQKVIDGLQSAVHAMRQLVKLVNEAIENR